MSLTLQFVRARGIASWLIARFGVQAPEFSHVDIVLENGRLLGARDDTVIAGGQTIPPGVRVRPPDYAKWVRKERLTFHVSHRAAAIAYDWAMGEVGKKYDEDAILGFVFGHHLHENGAFICSVFAGTFLQKAGVILEQGDLQGTSPNTLYAMCLALGAKAA